MGGMRVAPKERMKTQRNMKHASPPIREFMSEQPITIGKDQTVAFANRRMHEAGVRHLPVLDQGKVIGMISERDIALIEGLPGTDTEALRVEEAMSDEPYTVAPDAPLADVAAKMAAKKLGSAIVAEKEHVLGVFTTTDALRALAEMMG